MAAELAQSKRENLAAEAEIGARRSDHRTPKKSCGSAGPPERRATTRLDGRRVALAPAAGLIAGACAALKLSRASLHRRRALRSSRVQHASHPTKPAARTVRRGTLRRARSSARTALRRPGARRSLCQPARRGCLPLLDPHHVPHSRRQTKSASAAINCTIQSIKKPELLAQAPNRGLVLGYHKADGASQMDVLLPLRHHRYFQPQSRWLVRR